MRLSHLPCGELLSVCLPKSLLRLVALPTGKIVLETFYAKKKKSNELKPFILSFPDVFIHLKLNFDTTSDELEWSAVPYITKLPRFTKGFHRSLN